ncbi:MAG: hypothetical protein MJ033_07210 [Victivallaceae bacterium]|nr:hypothetical protein [Victivallaceae bacterium]
MVFSSPSFWIFFCILLFGMLAVTIWSNKYVKGVADFLSANRMARKYLLTVAGGMTGGAGMVATWEMYYSAGVTPIWWDQIGVPVGLVVAVTGFISYRFRETRALTLFQFFEMRYSRKFRIFAGFLSWISGVINYAIMPLVVAELTLGLLGLPETFPVSIGEITFQCNMAMVVMFFNLGLALFIAIVGGQISIMLTDFYQEVICKILIAVMLCFLVARFCWNDVFAGLAVRNEFVNPFNTTKIDQFNIWYFLIGVYGSIYNAKSWGGGAGYDSSAKTPHDAQMSGVLGRWRHLATQVCYILPPLIAYAVLHNPDLAEYAAPLRDSLGGDVNAEATKSAMVVVTSFLQLNLPGWVFGGFAAMIFACSVSIDDTCLHTWGSIFVQDFLLPLQKKKIDAKRHIRWLRLSITSVAVFAFLFSCGLYLLEKHYDFEIPIFMYYAVTGSIYLGGAGIVIFGGLYWKRGTTLAAWVSMISGGTLSFAGALLQTKALWHAFALKLLEIFPDCNWLADHLDQFPINGQVIYFIAMAVATLSYVVLSLVFPQPPFNLDRMLHRGKYRIADDKTPGESTEARRNWKEMIGYSLEFGKFDGFLFWFTICYCLIWWVCLLIGTCAFLMIEAGWIPGVDEIPLFVWSAYWKTYFVVQLVIMVVATAWLTLGGLYNAYLLPGDMREHLSLANDDGTVEDKKGK